VRVQWREDKDPETLKVQIVLRVQRPRPPQPDPKEALLCFIDVNSAYGITAVIAAYEEGRVKVYEMPKFRPPNQSRRLREAAKRESAAAYGSKPNTNYALARLSKKFDAQGWVKAVTARIFRMALEYAGGRPIWVNIDAPDHRTVRGSRLQRTLLSIKRVAANLANWYGIYATFRCYPSRTCPVCGGKLKQLKSKRARVMRCQCGFADERDYIPFHNWLRELGLPLPKRPISSAPLTGKRIKTRRPSRRARPAGKAGWRGGGVNGGA